MRIYKVNEVDKQRFFKVPKSLFNNEKYKGLSLEAKIIYAILRDRMELSEQNGWYNLTGEIYLLYSRENLSEIMECSEPTVRKAMKQLTKYELIVEKQQGQGKPNIIYICHTEKTLDIAKTEKTFRSGPKEISVLNRKNVSPNDTEYNDTDKSETNNDNDNGIFTFVKNSHPLEYREEINQSRKFFADVYKYVYRKEYHNHKAEQNRIIDEQLNSAFLKYSLSIENMEDMIKAYFKVRCDHNLMHFATDGILQNRMYEVAY